MNAFALDHVAMRFGGVGVLDDVSLHIASGEVLGLIGPNGAGKTTLFNIASGLLQPDDGTVWLAGEDVTDRPPEYRSRRGLARTFQRLEIFRALTVRENVQVAIDIRRGWRRRGDDGLVDVVLERVGIGDLADRLASSLPTGTARLLEVARALATTPSVLLLDEPASGLDPQETARLGELIRSLADENLAVLLVEHDVALVMRVCARVAVLDGGRVIADGLPDSVRRNPNVQAAYLGPEVDAAPVLSVDEVTA